MNRQNLEIHVKTGLARSRRGLRRCEVRSIGILRIGEWLADGFNIACSQPLMWLATILGSADLATALDLIAPLRLLAISLMAAFAVATILTPAGGTNSNRWTIGETFGVLRLHCDALCAVVLVCVAIVGGGDMLSFVLLHIKLTTAMMPSGAHSLSIIFSESTGRADLFEPTLHAIVLAIAVAAVWFAPALIVLQNLSPLEAIRTSLRAVLHNGQIALVYVAVLSVDALLGLVVPVLIRALVLTPLTSALIMLSLHGSYRDILSIDTAKQA